MSISLRLLQAAGGSGLNIAAGTTPSPGNYFSPYDANTSNRIYDLGGITFNSNGTKIYVCDDTGVNNSDDINQYSLATAYDLGSATFDTRLEITFAGAGISNVVGVKSIVFNNTGSKVFIQVQRSTGTAHQIAEYSLSTNYDLSSISSSPTTVWDYSNSKIPENIWFKPDGTKLFIIEDGNGFTHYNLSTAFDLSTMSASPDGETTWSAGSAPKDPVSLAINSDGTKVYVGNSLSSGASGQIVELRMSSAWDASTLVTSSGEPTLYNSTQFDDFERTIRPYGLYINSDDTKMFVGTNTRYRTGGSYSDNRVSGYDLSSAGDITTGTIMKPSTDFISIVEQSPTGLDTTASGPKNAGISFTSDGSTMFTIGKGSSYAKIFKWTLSTPWAVATASYSQNQDLNPQSSSVVDAVIFKNDGTLFVTKSGTTLYRFSMSTAWDITTATKDKDINLGSGKGAGDGMYITPDGTKIFTASGSAGTTKYFNEFTMSTAWDVSTATETNSVSMAAFTNLVFIQNFTFDTSGRVLIASSVTNSSGEAERNLVQFNLSKSFDLDTITSVTQELPLQNSASEFGEFITGMHLSPDNRYLHTVDGVTESIWRINLKG